jgi:hypothetical protein
MLKGMSKGSFIIFRDPETKEGGGQAAEGRKGKAAGSSTSSEDQK